MPSKFNLKDKVIACLRSQPEKRLTAKEIAEWIFEQYSEDCAQKRQQSKQDLHSDNALIQQISAEIRPNLFPENSEIKINAGRPRRFYRTEKTDTEEITEAEEENSADKTGDSEPQLKEADLYPLLAEFLSSEYTIYSKRIDEKRSSNKRGENGNFWLHPDMVGLEVSSQNWHGNIKQCAGKFFHETASLSAYEVKLKLNSANLREAFFQAVSNSSWANYGYLVAAEIDDKIEPELRLLANLHGIGIILLNTENPTESQIIIESGEREIDWDSVNRIAKENKDFMEYITCVSETIANGRIKKTDWIRLSTFKD